MVYAILTCLKLRSAGEPVNCPVKQWDAATRQEVDVIKPCFTTLHNKPIGLVIQIVHEDGQERPSPSIYGVFEASTELTASEILNHETEPKKLPKLVEYIINKPLNDKRKNKFATTMVPPPRKQVPNQPTPSSIQINDIEDDIPY